MSNTLLDRSLMDISAVVVDIDDSNINFSVISEGIAQTVQNNGIPTMIFYDAARKNFYAIPLPVDYNAGDIIAGVLR